MLTGKRVPKLPLVAAAALVVAAGVLCFHATVSRGCAIPSCVLTTL